MIVFPQQNIQTQPKADKSLGFIPFIPMLLPYLVGGKVFFYERASWDYYWNDVQKLWGEPFNNYVNRDIITVWNRINWNRCKAYGKTDAECAYNKQSYWFETDPTRKEYITFEQVEKCLQSYQNLCLAKDADKRVKEYVPKTQDAVHCINMVSLVSGVPEQRTKEILDGAYYALADGALNENFIIKPVTYHANKEYRNSIPEGEPSPIGFASDLARDIKNSIPSLFDWVKPLLFVGAAVGVVILITQARKAKA